MVSHLFHLNATTPQNVYSAGNRIDVTKDNFSALNGMSVSLLTLEAGGIREPHWHPNANELSYCLKGQALMTIFSPGSVHNTFTIQQGDIVFVPQGSIHHIENIGKTPFQTILCFDHSTPEDLQLSSSVSVMPPHILAATLNLKPEFFSKLSMDVKGVFISQHAEKNTPKLEWETNPYKMNLEKSTLQILAKGGTVKLSNNFLLPHLEGLAAYSVKLEQQGAREPHWHPNAAELNYLISGKARITLLTPSGQVDTFDMTAGDMSFMPQGYIHHIENTATEPAQFIIFFNHSAPSDIGLSGCMGAYSNDVLASLFGVQASYFDAMTKYQNDLFVISGAG